MARAVRFLAVLGVGVAAEQCRDVTYNSLSGDEWPPGVFCPPLLTTAESCCATLHEHLPAASWGLPDPCLATMSLVRSAPICSRWPAHRLPHAPRACPPRADRLPIQRIRCRRRRPRRLLLVVGRGVMPPVPGGRMGANGPQHARERLLPGYLHQNGLRAVPVAPAAAAARPAVAAAAGSRLHPLV